MCMLAMLWIKNNFPNISSGSPRNKYDAVIRSVRHESEANHWRCRRRRGQASEVRRAWCRQETAGAHDGSTGCLEVSCYLRTASRPAAPGRNRNSPDINPDSQKWRYSAGNSTLFLCCAQNHSVEKHASFSQSSNPNWPPIERHVSQLYYHFIPENQVVNTKWLTQRGRLTFFIISITNPKLLTQNVC